MSNHITHLSFTRLKELAHSPLALKRYIEETKKSTRAMDEGTLLDCLLFEPDTFDQRFFVMPEGLKKPTKAQLEAKKPSRESVAQIAHWEAVQAAINGRITITEEQKQEADRITITEEQKQKAEFLAESVRNNSTVAFQGLMHPDKFKFQQPVEYFFKGFKHRGIMDATGIDRNGNAVIWDLKRMGSRSGEQLVRAQIRHNKYDLQAAIYCHLYDLNNVPVDYYIIAVDNEGYVTPFRISRDAREQAAWEWRKLIAAAHRCNMEGLDMGPEFWGDSEGFFNF